MTPEEITSTLIATFGDAAQRLAVDSWQIQQDSMRLLVLLSNDQSWLRAFIPIAPLQEADPFLTQLLEANFDETQETRYAISQGVLWGVFQHDRESLTPKVFSAAIARLLHLYQKGLAPSFNQLVEQQIRQIIRAAKLQGQSLEATMQTLDRLYQEGVMGDINQNNQQRDEVLASWRNRLESLWPEVEP